MSMKGIANKPSRNGFDLSQKLNFTAKCGELLPAGVWECLNGDKFRIDMRAFARTQPLNTAAYARVREYYDFFYVPYSLLWNRANDVLTMMDYNQQHATGLTPTYDTYNGEVPYTMLWSIGSYIRNLSSSSTDVGVKKNFFGYDRATLSCKLLEYLGYGDFSPYLSSTPVAGNFRYNLDVNIFGLLAYQKIYSDFYRDEQWEKPSPSTFNVDYMTGQTSMAVTFPSSVSGEFYSNYNMFDLRYCNWQKDLYHGILPQAQYGETASVPLSTFTNNASFPVTDGTISTGSGKEPVTTTTWNRSTFQYIASADGFSILALRQYEFLQKWKEIAQANDQNYKAQTKAIWNVDVPDNLAGRVQYLGGINSSLDINEVLNTNITGDNQAEIAGKGVSVSNGVIELNNVTQPGLLMCIYHCMPIVDYTVNYINPSFLRVTAEDFANPVFDRVGMEPLSSATIANEYVSNKNTPDTPFILGYVPRYATYKTNIDISVGAFKDNLSQWVVSYDYASFALGLSGGLVSTVGPDGEPTDGNSSALATYVFLKINPNLLDPIFATAVDSTVSTDQFLISSFFDIKVVRNLDSDGLPY